MLLCQRPRGKKIAAFPLPVWLVICFFNTFAFIFSKHIIALIIILLHYSSQKGIAFIAVLRFSPTQKHLRKNTPFSFFVIIYIYLK